jgi:acyl-CoA dehydrogenase
MTNHSRNILPEMMLSQPARQTIESLSAWLPVWRSTCARFGSYGPYVSAIAAALQADRMAWAFFSGYQGALQAAFPILHLSGEGEIASLGANESGARLTEIGTTLSSTNGELRLNGQKSWVIAGAEDMTLYVLARLDGGPARGPGSLGIVRIPRSSMGVEMGTPRPQSVVPELPHSGVAFMDVLVCHDQLVSGDGYADYAKPFRLREDVSVTGCTLAFLLSKGHLLGWPTHWRQRCIAVIVTLGECAAMPPNEPTTELLTAGALALGSDNIQEAEAHWAEHATPDLERWNRDKPILALGKEARRQRVQNAWSRIGWPV